MTGLATTAPNGAFAENVGYLLTPFPAKAKRLHLFGVSEAETIRDRLGGAPLTVNPGTGGMTYTPNYVDCRALAQFVTPAVAPSRDCTMIWIGTWPSVESVYDGDMQYRFPPTVSKAAEMQPLPGGYALAWNGTGQFMGASGSSLRFIPEDGVVLTEGTYAKVRKSTAYRDGSWTKEPFCVVAGYGPAGAYLHFQSQGAFVKLRTATPYPNPPRPASVTRIGNPRAEANGHVLTMAFAEYSYLSEDDAQIAAGALCGMVEARGFKNFSHTPQDMRS